MCCTRTEMDELRKTSATVGRAAEPRVVLDAMQVRDMAEREQTG